MAITRRQTNKIASTSLQHSRRLRSGAVHYTQPAKWTPFQQPPQPRRKSGRQQINPEDVGLPNDGKWDLIAAHESRFCFQHEEDEWLLESKNKWMDPSDFNIPGAEAALEAKLQKYDSSPRDLNRYRLASKAECYGNLWSHIDTPIQRGNLGDKVIYLIRWKLCWTPQSHIGDVNWARSSFNTQNERIQRRRSARVEKTAPERAAKRESMMVVVKLEDWL